MEQEEVCKEVKLDLEQMCQEHVGSSESQVQSLQRQILGTEELVQSQLQEVQRASTEEVEHVRKAEAENVQQEVEQQRWRMHEESSIRSHLLEFEEQLLCAQAQTRLQNHQLGEDIAAELESSRSMTEVFRSQVVKMLTPMTQRLEVVEHSSLEAVRCAHEGEAEIGCRFASELHRIHQVEEAMNKKVEDVKESAQLQVQRAESVCAEEAEHHHGAELRIQTIEEQHLRTEAEARIYQQRLRDELHVEFKANRDKMLTDLQLHFQEALMPMKQHLEDVERQCTEAVMSAQAGEKEAFRDLDAEIHQARNTKKDLELQMEEMKRAFAHELRTLMPLAFRAQAEELLAPMAKRLEDVEYKYIKDIEGVAVLDAELRTEQAAQSKRSEAQTAVERGFASARRRPVAATDGVQTAVEKETVSMHRRPASASTPQAHQRRQEFAVLRLAQAEEQRNMAHAQAQAEWRLFKEKLRSEHEADLRRQEEEAKLKQREAKLRAESKEIEWRAEMQHLKSELEESKGSRRPRSGSRRKPAKLKAAVVT